MNSSTFVFCGGNTVTFGDTVPTMQDKEGIVSVTWPTVTTLPTNAFRSINTLLSVHMPNVTSIGTYGFYASPYLETVTLPKLAVVPGYTFHGCYRLKYLTLGSPGYPVTLMSGSCSSTTCQNVTDHDVKWIIYTSTGKALSGYPWGGTTTNLPASGIEWRQA